MLEIFSPVTVPLGITNLDFVIALSVLIYSGIFAFLGTEKAYSAFYGTVVGIGIYVVLQTLLSPTYQSVETAKFIGPATSKFFIATSAYLIPILFFLSPANGKLKIEGSGNMAVRILESMAVSVWALMLMVAVCKGLANKTYVFTTDSAFTLLSKSAWYGKLSVGSEIFAFLSAHLQTIVLVSVLFAIYKAFFAEIVSAAVMA